MSDLKFRSSIWVTAWGAIAINSWMFVVIPLLLLWVSSSGNLKYSVTYACLTLFIPLIAFAFIISTYNVYTYQLIVKPTGIYGYDFRGNGSFVAWDEMDRIETYNLLGCKYLRLFFVNSTVPLWIPLFLAKPNKFTQTIIEYTKKTNPLHIALLNKDKLANKVAFWEQAKNKSKPENNKTKQGKVENFLKLNPISSSTNTNIPPWMENKVFSSPPSTDTYGYCNGEKLLTCSRPSLIENIKSDHKKLITLIWTPETPYLVSPEEIVWLHDALHAREKSFFKKALQSDFLNCLFWGAIFWQNLSDSSAVRQIMLFNWMAIALIPTIEHAWGLYQSRIKTPQRLQENSQQNRYTAWIKNSDAPWTQKLVAAVSLVAIVQAIIFFIPQINSSIATAGIVKPAVWQGEVWRLLTGTLLHGNLLHFLFNISALLVLSKLIEVTTHRIYVPLIFLISALSGSLFSLFLIPDLSSVGASGGIMGLLGFLFILSRKHKHLFPVTHQQMLAKATVYTFLAGLLAHEVIDNPAHLGGFLAGTFLGWQLIPHQRFTIPIKQVPLVLEVMGKITAS
ncbi:MAG: rhomboid family intramembrane serine protease [Cyanobacteria bacterium J06558_2]